MQEEIELMVMSLRFDFGYFIGVTAWISCLRLAFSFVNLKIKEFAEQSLPAEKESIQRFLDSLPWRITVFIVNMLVSIKLPTVARKGTTTIPETLSRP